MDGSCTILFEDPFWVAIFEINDEKGYRAARHVFGALPNEAELHLFALLGLANLNFSAPQKGEKRLTEFKAFKRRQREVRRQVEGRAEPKKAWEAIKIEHEAQKKEKRQAGREEKEAAAQGAYLARQARKKEKKRGR